MKPVERSELLDLGAYEQVRPHFMARVIEGRSVAVNLAPSGYGFERRVSGAWQPLPGRAFEQRNWPGGLRFIAASGEGVTRILFDRVGTSPTPQAVVLSGGDAREIVRVSATGDVSRGE